MKTMMSEQLRQWKQNTVDTALETGLSFPRSDYHYECNPETSKPHYDLFSAMIAGLEQLHTKFSGSFHILAADG